MVSRDAGRSFRAVEALEGRYVRAVLFGPRHPRVVYLSAAEEGAPPLPLDLAKIWAAAGGAVSGIGPNARSGSVPGRSGRPGGLRSANYGPRPFPGRGRPCRLRASGQEDRSGRWQP